MKGITSESDLASLTLLGGEGGQGKGLETFPNHHQGRDYRVTLVTSEFTCLCPKTGQPDFARVTIAYTPDNAIVESKSLKLYLASFRNQGAFHEHVTNVILDDLVKAMAPRWCKVHAEFAVRGGIAITVEAEYTKEGFTPPVAIPPPRAQAGISSYDARKKRNADDDRSPAPRWEGVRDRSRRGGDRHSQEREREWQGKNAPPPGRDRYGQTRSGQRFEEPHRPSERKTTKSLGETRTWRKRV